MKIRIVGNTVRLRLSKSETEELYEEGQVLEQTAFASNIFRYSIGLSDEIGEPSASFDNGHIRILLPESEAYDWINSDRTGLENFEYTEQGDGLKLLIEKDFQCLHERKNEDESDAFPNPLAQK